MSATSVCCDCAAVGALQGHGRCARCYGRHRWATQRRVCTDCGRLRPHGPGGRCPNCAAKQPDRPHLYAARLAGQLSDPPEWLLGFADHLAARVVPNRASQLLGQLKPILLAGTTAPTAVLDAARTPAGSTVGALARALEAFFVQARLALPLDQADRAAQTRRARRVGEVPQRFRPAAERFHLAQREAQQRARRAGTKPRTDRTLEINLSAVRDLARYLDAHHPAPTDWAGVSSAHVEAFLAPQRPANRARHLQCLRGFFRWARTQRLILIDPTRQLQASSNIPFRGPVLDLDTQRSLYRRWTNDVSMLHPQEPTVGLLGLLHGASQDELRRLLVTDIDLTAATVQLGRRPNRSPLDPATADAIRACLQARTEAQRLNPHLLVNQSSKTVHGPVSVCHLEKVLAPAGVTPRLLRATRLSHLVTVVDPIMVAAAFGIRFGAVRHYLTDTVDPARLANL